MSLKSNRKVICAVVSAILIYLIGVSGFLLYKQNQLSIRSEDFSKALVAQRTAIDQIYNHKYLYYEPSSNELYLPELRIKIPYNTASKSLLYSMRLDEKGSENQEADISTNKFSPPPDETQLDCTQFLRLKIEDKQNPYNPAEWARTYKLKNGLSLKVYVFSGELEGNSQCKNYYDAQGVYPKDFLKAFDDVQSY